MDSIVNLLQPLVSPLIINSRAKARKYIYSYIVTNGIYLNVFTESQYVKKDFVVIKTNIFLYYWYYLTVWIWLDDSLDNDYLSNNHIKSLYYNTKHKWLRDRIKDHRLLKGHKCYSYLEGTTNKAKPIKTDTVLLVISNYNHYNNNYCNKNFFTVDKSKVFLITIFNRKFGWEEVKTVFELNRYKLVFNKK